MTNQFDCSGRIIARSEDAPKLQDQRKKRVSTGIADMAGGYGEYRAMMALTGGMLDKVRKTLRKVDGKGAASESTPSLPHVPGDIMDEMDGPQDDSGERQSVEPVTEVRRGSFSVASNHRPLPSRDTELKGPLGRGSTGTDVDLSQMTMAEKIRYFSSRK
jgi:hypothetical protein